MQSGVRHSCALGMSRAKSSPHLQASLQAVESDGSRACHLGFWCVQGIEFLLEISEDSGLKGTGTY